MGNNCGDFKVTRKLTLEERIIESIERDDYVIKEAISSISKLIKKKTEGQNTTEITEVHEKLGEILSKYVQVSVKNTAQLVQMHSINRTKSKKVVEGEVEPVDNEIEGMFDSLEEDKNGKS